MIIIKVEKEPFLREIECTGAVYFREDKQKEEALKQLSETLKLLGGKKPMRTVCSAYRWQVQEGKWGLQKGRLRLEVTSEI